MPAASPISLPDLEEEEMPGYEDRIKGLETSVGNIRESLGNIKGQLKVLQQPIPKTTHPLLPVIGSALCLAVLWYWGWIGTQVVAHGKQISQILTILSPEIIKNAATRPDDAQSIKQVELIARKAVKQGERIDTTVISDAGDRFVNAATDTPEAWKAATALLDYKSFLNVTAIPAPQPTASIDKKATFNAKFNYKSLTNKGQEQIEWLGITHPPNLPELHSLDAPDENAELSAGPQFLFIRNAQLDLDNMRIKNVIIRDSRIVYDGQPLELENVYFVNCTFEVRRDAWSGICPRRFCVKPLSYS